MKINPKYRLRNVSGKSIIMAENSLSFEGIPTLNKTAEFIWKKLEAGAEAEDIVKSLADECNVSPDEIRDEVTDFIDLLIKAKIVE